MFMLVYSPTKVLRSPPRPRVLRARLLLLVPAGALEQGSPMLMFEWS